MRSEALDSAIAGKQPLSAMEIGSYCGYTAVRMGSKIPAGGKLISVEIDPLYAAIATKVRAASFAAITRCRRATARCCAQSPTSACYPMRDFHLP